MADAVDLFAAPDAQDAVSGVKAYPLILPWVPERGGGPPPGDTVLWVMVNGQLEPVQGVVKGT